MVLRTAYSSCPICTAVLGRKLGVFDCTRYPHYRAPLPKAMTWLKCTQCGHVHTDGYWTEKGLRILLERSHPGQTAGGDPDQKRALWAQTVQSVLQAIGDAGTVFGKTLSWIDIGCGDGALVMTAAEFGFKAIGVDVRPESVAALSSMNYEAVQGDLQSISMPQPFDVLSLADVLEHLPFPRLALEKASGFLKTGGVLFISCPNTDTASWRVMDAAQENPYWVEMEHCHNFSRGLLMTLLRETGFAPVAYGVSQRYKCGMEIVARRIR